MMKKTLWTVLLSISISLSSSAVLAQGDAIKKAQALRQAPMKLIANNFGYMSAMAKGKMAWNADEFMARGKELGALGQLDLLRGYVDDSYAGKTRVKPEVELEFDDYTEKMRKFEQALRDFAAKPNADAMKLGLKDLGKSCKSCHKKYKSKEYQDH